VIFFLGSAGRLRFNPMPAHEFEIRRT